MVVVFIIVFLFIAGAIFMRPVWSRLGALAAYLITETKEAWRTAMEEYKKNNPPK